MVNFWSAFSNCFHENTSALWHYFIRSHAQSMRSPLKEVFISVIVHAMSNISFWFFLGIPFWHSPFVLTDFFVLSTRNLSILIIVILNSQSGHCNNPNISESDIDVYSVSSSIFPFSMTWIVSLLFESNERGSYHLALEAGVRVGMFYNPMIRFPFLSEHVPLNCEFCQCFWFSSGTGWLALAGVEYLPPQLWGQLDSDKTPGG